MKELPRICFRPTQADAATLDAIHDHLRRDRRGWVSQTDAIRYALKAAAEKMAPQEIA